jgi:ribosomal protein S18 acetylase RimI-like enzyme
MLIRAATTADLDACAALGGAESGERPETSRARVYRDLADPDRRLLVAIVAGELAGYGRAVVHRPPEHGPANAAPAGRYLGGLLVGPRRRRQGIGLALTRERMAWGLGHAGEVWFFADARDERSLALHRKLGFIEVTRDFAFPGVTFAGGTGVLCRATRETSRLGAGAQT